MRPRLRLRPLPFAVLLALLAGPALAGWDDGVAAYTSGDFAGAVSHFRAFAADRPEAAAGHRMLGQSLVKLGRMKEALPPLEKAFELEPGDASTRLVLAQVQIAVGKAGDALKVLDGTTGLSGAPATLRERLRGTALVALDRPKEAVDALQVAAKATPADLDLQRQLGLAALQAERLDVAVPALESATRGAKADATLLAALAGALRRQADARPAGERPALCQRAAAAAQRACDAEPSAERLALLAESQACGGDAAAARATFARAADAAGADAWRALYRRGRLAEDAEDWTDAKADFEAALAKGPPATDAAQIRGRLGQTLERLGKLAAALAVYRQLGDAASITRVETNLEAERQAQVQKDLEAKDKELQDKLRDLDKQRDAVDGGARRPPSG